jgi:hypothetical protein
MQFLHIADIHLGYQQYGLEARFDDFSKVFLHLVDEAIAQQVDFVLLAGDLFHKRSVDPLAMTLGTEVETLMDQRGVLRQREENVTLQGPSKRRQVKDLGLPAPIRQPAPLIKAIHQAATLWEKGDRAALTAFLAEAACGREEQVRVVTHTPADVLPEDDC